MKRIIFMFFIFLTVILHSANKKLDNCIIVWDCSRNDIIKKESIKLKDDGLISLSGTKKLYNQQIKIKFFFHGERLISIDYSQIKNIKPFIKIIKSNYLRCKTDKYRKHFKRISINKNKKINDLYFHSSITVIVINLSKNKIEFYSKRMLNDYIKSYK